MRFLRQEYWSGLLFPLPVDHFLSDLFSEQQHIIWSVSVVPLIWLQVVSWRASLVLLVWNEEYWSLPFVGTFLSIKSLKIMFIYPLRRNQDPTPTTALLFLSCSCLVSAHPPFSDCCCVPLLILVWLWPHGLQQARLPYPVPSLGACLNSCQWCHPTISSSVHYLIWLAAVQICPLELRGHGD